VTSAEALRGVQLQHRHVPGCHTVTLASELNVKNSRGGYCHFCFHCKVENIGDHCPSPLCPQRDDPSVLSIASCSLNEPLRGTY
jgi:hypothetical protein